MTLSSHQIKQDLFTFGETVKDYIALLGAIRVSHGHRISVTLTHSPQAAFDMRVRACNTWQASQQTLSKKREQEQKLTATGKMDKLQLVKAEIEEVGVVCLCC